jgi:hypothetical protein
MAAGLTNDVCTIEEMLAEVISIYNQKGVEGLPFDVRLFFGHSASSGPDKLTFLGC